MIDSVFVRITDSRFKPAVAGHEIITTLEGENPGKSIKDRMVHGELAELLQSGVLKQGDPIAEISAGSTALSLAYYCRQFGLQCSLFVPLTLDPELMKELESFGARLYPVDPSKAYEQYEQFILNTGIRKLDQFGDLKLRRHYRKLGEALASMASVSNLVGSVGTGHSLLGIAQGLKSQVRVISAEPVKPGTVSGIRNLRLESYGKLDPCDPSQMERVEIDENEYFPFSRIETDHGWIQISDSFRVVLGVIDKITRDQSPRSTFAIGAKNCRLDSFFN